MGGMERREGGGGKKCKTTGGKQDGWERKGDVGAGRKRRGDGDLTREFIGAMTAMLIVIN